MAGIGFALRRLGKESYGGIASAYLLAGIIGSGPWLISIVSMLFIGFWAQHTHGDALVVTQFLASVTYLMSGSLILSSILQLMFVRFVADRLFEKKPEVVVPNMMGAMLVTTCVAGAAASVFVSVGFEGVRAFRVLFVVAFVALCNVWVLSVLLSGMKAYRSVVLVFLGGYTINVLTGIALERLGLAGYLAGFCIGHVVMLFAMLVLVFREYPCTKLIAFDFLKRKNVFLELSVTGALFNLAVWVDKFIFWANPVTSEVLVGTIRYSVVYDVPVFIAYLSVVPGMAVFLVRIETDFAEAYDKFYTAVREGDSLAQLERLRNQLVEAARAGIYDIFRIQGLTAAVLLLVGARVLALFRIPVFYEYLFKIDVIGVAFQVVLLGIFTILFYLDYRRLVLALCAFFAVANIGLSIASQMLGPRFYGFGFAVSAALTSLLSLGALSYKLDRLEYETFMR
jgi:uncharacterized membrane protein